MDLMEFKAGLSDRLYKARTVKGYSQMRLAVELDVAQNTVHGWETAGNRRVPTAYHLKRLCEVLGVTADWLLFGKEV